MICQWNNDTYEILERIGYGAFGEVYKVRDQRNGKIVAMKSIRMKNGTRDHAGIWINDKTTFKKIFNIKLVKGPKNAHREMTLFPRLNHNNIIHASDVISLQHGKRGIIMEYMDIDLAQVQQHESLHETILSK